MNNYGGSSLENPVAQEMQRNLEGFTWLSHDVKTTILIFNDRLRLAGVEYHLEDAADFEIDYTQFKNFNLPNSKQSEATISYLESGCDPKRVHDIFTGVFNFKRNRITSMAGDKIVGRSWIYWLQQKPLKITSINGITHLGNAKTLIIWDQEVYCSDRGKTARALARQVYNSWNI